jgi:anti-sigma-K factor RskA
MDRHTLIDLIPAYALGALDPDERDAVEALLRGDAGAQALLAEYEAVTGHLALLVPEHAPPARLAGDLRARLAADRAARPAEPHHADGPARRLARWWWLVAAAAAVLVVVIGGVLLLDQDEPPDEPPIAPITLYMELLEQEGASRFAVVPDEGNEDLTGELLVAARGDRGVLCMTRLPALSTDQVFQLWMIDRDGARTSGGVFTADPAGESIYLHVPFSAPVAAYQGLGVSIEPPGGSPYPDQPTGPRVFSVPLGS